MILFFSQFFSELLGRDAHTQRMRALRDIEFCKRKLSSILLMSVFDPEFDDERHALEKMLADCHGRLKEAVTFNDWWSLLEEKKAQKRAALGE